MSDIKPRVSIIIPHWNNTDILSDCLESITLTSYLDLETIVVDNASTDDSVEWVKSNYPNVKLIENDKNYGYAGGCNIGAEYASGEYLIFLNNDNLSSYKYLNVSCPSSQIFTTLFASSFVPSLPLLQCVHLDAFTP